VIGLTLIAVFLLKHGAQCSTRHETVEEVTETVGLAVFTGCVVGVCQASHKDDASFLAKTLNSNRHTGG